MSVVEKLLVVQDLDCAIRDAMKELHDIPARQKQEESRLDEHKAALEEAEDNLKARQAEIKQLEIESQAGAEQIAKLRQQQLEIKTNKEFKAIEGEVKAVQDKISGIEDQELVLMEELEKATAEVEERRAALQEEERAIEKDRQVLEERAATLQREAAKLQETRDEKAKDIDTEWLERYNLIMERKDRALVRVENSNCGGCHMKLPPAVVHGAQARNAMVFCDHCGRLLC